MKQIRRWTAAGSLFAVVLLAAASVTATPTDEAQIRALEASFSSAVAAGDINGIMKVYAPDVFVFDVVPPRQYVGAAAYQKDWEGFFAGLKGAPQFQITDLSVTADGDMAYGHSIQRISGTDSKGAKVDLTVRVSDVYRKTGGAWKIVQEHVSVPVDLTTGKPDTTPAP